MITFWLVKTVIAVGPANDESYCAEFAKLVVNGVNIEAAHQRQFSDVSLLSRRGEEQPQKLRSHRWKEDI
jgi:hypothetical protein